MYLINELPRHGQPLDPRDAETLSIAGAESVQHALRQRWRVGPHSWA